MNRLLAIVSFALWIFSSMGSLAQGSDYEAFSRLDYYTTETEGEIAIFVPESKQEMSITVDLAFEFEFLIKGAVAFPGHYIPVGYPMSRLHSGDNEITVSFYENEKWVDSRKVNVVLRESSPNEVKIDRLTGTMIADGLPFFPVGFYCGWPSSVTMPEEEAVRGFNLLSPYWSIDKKGRKDRLEFMDRCAELGIKVNYNLCSVAGGGGVTSSHGIPMSREEKMKLLRKEVETMRNHPALLAWYISDEPEGQGMPADSLQAAYDLIRNLDPYHPVTIVFMAPKMAIGYKNVMDIVMTDPYPIPNGPVTEVEDYMKVLNGYFQHEKPVWLVPQAFGGDEWWTREPNPAEVRAMSYLGLVNGASGLQYFIRKGPNASPKSSATYGECGEIAQELMELLPCLASGHPAPAITTSQLEIRARAINEGGLFYILVVNTSVEPAGFFLEMAEIDLTLQAQVMFEGRTIEMAEGKIIDMIDGLGTRVYRLDNRQKLDWMNDFHPKNMVVDPGFEHTSSPAIPSACYIGTGFDKGSTAFLDGREKYQGDHSLKLVTPSAGGGLQLSFFGLELDPDCSYTVSVYGKMAPDRLQDEKGCNCGGRKAENSFDLSLGRGEPESFVLTENWKQYSFCTSGRTMQPSLARWYFPGLTLNSRGTAWFDVLQVVPDLEMNNRRGEGEKGRMIELISNHPDKNIFYTLDGSEPTIASEQYITPFPLKQSGTIKAVAVKNGLPAGMIRRDFVVHTAVGSSVSYQKPYEKYTASGDDGLVDGVMATTNYKDGKWQGFHGQDAEFIIDLGEAMPVKSVAMNFLQDLAVWIFLPQQVQVSLSNDGISFQKTMITSSAVPLDKRGALIETFKAEFKEASTRYLKVQAKSIGNCPEWHSGAGQPAWVFLDEVVVE
jgi:hypothetical protein